MAALTQDHDKTQVIFGSAELVQTLLRRDPIDAIALLIHPLVLDTGCRLLPEGGPPTRAPNSAPPTPAHITAAASHRENSTQRQWQ